MSWDVLADLGSDLLPEKSSGASHKETGKIKLVGDAGSANLKAIEMSDQDKAGPLQRWE